METFLLIVTFVALALAVGMAVVAWKLLRDDRQRAAARVEALEFLAAGDGDEVPPMPEWAAVKAAPAVAAAAPVAPKPPPPPAAREPVLNSLASWDARLGTDRPPAPAAEDVTSRRRPAMAAEPMFGATVEHESGTPGRRWVAVAAVALILAAVVSGVYAFYGPEAEATVTKAFARPQPSGGTLRPLELLSLRHASSTDGSFTVTGLVENPSGGLLIEHIVAVVYLFDRDGNYFASGTAALDFTALHPGEESPFIVRVANVGRVSRYRVGFRSEAGGVIAHIDRRHQDPGATTGDAIDGQVGIRPAVGQTPTQRRSEG